jgi:hypothetical protein
MMQGMILYDGKSEIDGEPIVAIVTGLKKSSNNVKTGGMAQIYILRSDMHPLDAVHTGADRSICGDCVHRGQIETDPVTGKRRNVGRSCYVTLIHGPRMVYDAYLRGYYESVEPMRARWLLRDHRVRIGAYGDPAAVPMGIWTKALSQVRKMTGYTHQWRRFPYLADYCMASVDSPAEREAAQALGFRTFRVRGKGEPLLHGEGQCPASAEMGKATTCSDCMLCGGLGGPGKADITIQAHGAGARNFLLAA